MPLLLFNSLHNDWNQVARGERLPGTIQRRYCWLTCLLLSRWALALGLSVGESGFAASQATARVLCSIAVTAHSENPVRTTISFHVH